MKLTRSLLLCLTGCWLGCSPLVAETPDARINRPTDAIVFLREGQLLKAKVFTLNAKKVVFVASNGAKAIANATDVQGVDTAAGIFWYSDEKQWFVLYRIEEFRPVFAKWKGANPEHLAKPLFRTSPPIDHRELKAPLNGKLVFHGFGGKLTEAYNTTVYQIDSEKLVFQTPKGKQQVRTPDIDITFYSKEGRWNNYGKRPMCFYTNDQAAFDESQIDEFIFKKGVRRIGGGVDEPAVVAATRALIENPPITRALFLHMHPLAQYRVLSYQGYDKRLESETMLVYTYHYIGPTSFLDNFLNGRWVEKDKSKHFLPVHNSTIGVRVDSDGEIRGIDTLFVRGIPGPFYAKDFAKNYRQSLDDHDAGAFYRRLFDRTINPNSSDARKAAVDFLEKCRKTKELFEIVLPKDIRKGPLEGRWISEKGEMAVDIKDRDGLIQVNQYYNRDLAGFELLASRDGTQVKTTSARAIYLQDPGLRCFPIRATLSVLGDDQVHIVANNETVKFRRQR